MKISEAQKRALERLPCTIITWGDRPYSGMPKGIKSRTTLWALRNKGMASLYRSGTTDMWSITPLGAVALANSNSAPAQG